LPSPGREATVAACVEAGPDGPIGQHLACIHEGVVAEATQTRQQSPLTNPLAVHALGHGFRRF
jgi:hypothetical protein